MPDAPPLSPHPVSDWLEEELRVLAHRHSSVVWLDRHEEYGPFVDALQAKWRAGSFPCPVLTLRGSYLELMLALAEHANDGDRSEVIVHLPGHNQESVCATPLLELYKAGYTHLRRLGTALETVAAGVVAPDELREFLAQQDLTVARADVWLAQRQAPIAGGFAAELATMEPRWIVEGLLVDRQQSKLAEPLRDRANWTILWEHLERQVGIDAAWRKQWRPDSARGDEALALGAWLLCVEYVHDLTRTPATPWLAKLRKLPKPLAKTCSELAAHLREHHAARYERLANAVEADLHLEQETVAAHELGDVDTFRFEEARILEAAIQAALAAARPGARASDWDQAAQWAEERSRATCFWLRQDQARRWAWQLVAAACAFGRTLAQHVGPLETALSLEEAVDEYAGRSYAVDLAHRRFEQTVHTHLEPQLRHFGLLCELRDSLRHRYRFWADGLARQFTTACRVDGFLPPAHLQQRHLFTQIVQPLTTGDRRVALFLVDALRWEMAVELRELLADRGTHLDLKPRLAELPTVTSVGMNVLAPVLQDGRLTPALDSKGNITGFTAQEFLVRNPETRAKAMGNAAGSTKVPRLTLAEVCEDSETRLKNRVRSGQLVLVVGTELDEAGHPGLGLTTFEPTLRRLASAVDRLLSAGVTAFVITADHGFLLSDDTVGVCPYGTKRDPHARHVVSEIPRQEKGMVPVSYASLGYGSEDRYLLLREDTAVYDTGGARPSFVHGGNSPQERVIPVLTILHRKPQPSVSGTYLLHAKPMADVLGYRRLQITARRRQEGNLSLLSGPAALRLALRVPDRPDVHVRLREATGDGRLERGELLVTVGDGGAELLFELTGTEDEKVQVEILHAGSGLHVDPIRPDVRFAVNGTAQGEEATQRAVKADSDWLERLGNAEARKVFAHLIEHASVTEAELVKMLGGARRERRFGKHLKDYNRLAPFTVEVEGSPTGKRYVKVEEKG